MNRGRNLVRSLTSDDGLNAELLPGVPIVEICEQRRVLIENHQGIVGYGRNEIHVKSCFGRICVCGENLKLKQMSKNKLVITGNICAVHLRGRG